MFQTNYPLLVKKYLVSVLKNVAGCSENSFKEIYTNRINHSSFTPEIQKGLLDDFGIKYISPVGNDPMIDDTGLTWDSGLKLETLVRYIERNATNIDDLLHIVAVKETMENPNRLVLIPKNLVKNVLYNKNFLKNEFNISIIVDFPVFHNCYSDDVDMTWYDHTNEKLMLQNLKNYLSKI